MHSRADSELRTGYEHWARCARSLPEVFTCHGTVLFTSVEEVVFTLFVCLLAGLHKLYSTDFQQNSDSCYAMVRVLVTFDVPRHIHQDCVTVK